MGTGTLIPPPIAADRHAARRRWPPIAALAATAALVVWLTTSVVQDGWLDSPYGSITVPASVAPAWLLPAGAAALWWWQPTSRPARIMLALGVVWAVFAGITATGWSVAPWLKFVAVLALRPLAFWLVLSWPTGYLDRTARRWLVVYTAVEVACWGVISVLFGDAVYGASNPFMIVDVPAATAIGHDVMVMLVFPASAAIITAVLVDRYRRLRGEARSIVLPALIASVVLVASELVFLGAEFTRSALSDDEGFTLAGAIVFTAADWARFSIIPTLFLVSEHRRRAWVTDRERVRTTSIDRLAPAEASTTAAVGALHDPTATVLFRGDNAWVGPDGRSVEVGADDRITTVIVRDGEPIAAVEYAHHSDLRPAAVEGAVSTAAASIEIERLAALARAREATAQDARRALIEVSDRIRRHIQRDLHDGAQQRLVGLALQVQLVAASRGETDHEQLAHDIADGVSRTRVELHELVLGRWATADRSLADALRELASTLPLPVHVDVDADDGLPDDVRAAAWFAASEGATNAIKYAAANRLAISSEFGAGRIVVTVSDDGAGGASISSGGGLDGLRARVERLGGRLAITSPHGGGTHLCVELPAGAAA